MRRHALGLAFALAILSPSAAWADGFVNLFIGRALNPSEGAGHQATNRQTFGVGVGSMGGMAGFEIDFGRTPHFFGEEDELGTNNVTTLMFNLMLSAPLDRGGAGLRPYALGGVGLIKSRLEGLSELVDIDANDFGMDLGFGVIGFVGRGFGVRGDLRYFRNLSDTQPNGEIDIDLGDFSFWRATVGATLRF